MNDTWYLPFFSGLWEESVRLVGALGFLHLFVLLPVSLVLVWRARRRPPDWCARASLLPLGFCGLALLGFACCLSSFAVDWDFQTLWLASTGERYDPTLGIAHYLGRGLFFVGQLTLAFVQFTLFLLLKWMSWREVPSDQPSSSGPGTTPEPSDTLTGSECHEHA